MRMRRSNKGSGINISICNIGYKIFYEYKYMIHEAVARNKTIK